MKKLLSTLVVFFSLSGSLFAGGCDCHKKDKEKLDHQQVKEMDCHDEDLDDDLDDDED